MEILVVYEARPNAAQVSPVLSKNDSRVHGNSSVGWKF